MFQQCCTDNYGKTLISNYSGLIGSILKLPGKKNEKEWETWMEDLIIEDTIQKENIPFYKYSEFQNVKLIAANVFKATFKISKKTVALENVYLNDEVKRHRKLETHDSILKFRGITKKKNIKNYKIILEYVNEGSLRQYLKTNFQKMDWNAKLNLAKQIANVLMFLHSNDIIHGKFNFENILVHNGIIKLNVFGLIKIILDSLSFLANNLGPIQYMDSQYLEHFSTIGKNKSSDIFGLGIILWEIFSECWNHNGNSQPDIFQVVKNLSEIIISDASVEFEASKSQPHNATDVKLENLNTQNEEHEIKPDPSLIDITTEVNGFINDLFEIFIDARKKQFPDIRPIIIKNYIRERKKNPVKLLYEMIRHPSHYSFTSLIRFFYQYGIGTVVDYQMALKFFNFAANEIIDTSSPKSLSLWKLYNINKEIGTISLVLLTVIYLPNKRRKQTTISRD
ncbi:hypothetical protein Glove_60g152 [Diversispora epigaea]|uniref:Protein kinase domain-containing protein n=1 Tax=Diversispora epigaea TaxID=1348612 RepID=A0A397JF88_9GLOM|nr:hypothetical protein Glove_60g152 [Diversispora epigaea]